MKKLLLILFGFPLIGFGQCVKGDCINYFLKKTDIDPYPYNKYNELIAVVDSSDCASLISVTEGCFTINKVEDFNDDGYLDVMISYCEEGNSFPPFYCIYSYNGKEFIKSAIIGERDWDGIEIIYDNGQFIFVEDFVPSGRGYTDLHCNDIKRTYIFNKHDFELLNSNSDNLLNAVNGEIRSSDFKGSYYDIKKLKFDLNNDGKADVINCRYWERWGSIWPGWTVNFSNGIIFKSESAPKRIGIMSTKTNNVNDIVVDCNVILKWNGQTYE